MSLFKLLENAAYRDGAERRLKNRINDEFDNFDIEHAEILASVMIGKCSPDDDVRIYSGALNNRCYAEALGKSHARSIRVLLDGLDESGISSLAWLKETPVYKRKCLEVRILKDMNTLAAENSLAVPEGHFFFTTANAYRKETCHENVTARVNFFDLDEVTKLSKSFDDWFALGVPVDL